MNRSRRNVLSTASVAAVTAAIAGTSSMVAEGAWLERKNTLEFLRTEFRHLDSFGRIGQRYLATLDGKIGLRELVPLLESHIEKVSGAEPRAKTMKRQNRRLLSDAVTKDFETGNVVDVDGWVLSETEAIVCSILHLSQNNRPG